MRACRFISALLFVGILSNACAAASVESTPARRKMPQLQCVTIQAPEPEKNKAPTKTCDDVCGIRNTVCVSNGDMTNPRSCETPTTASCRCCSIIEAQ
jgi:hypothetical protein